MSSFSSLEGEDLDRKSSSQRNSSYEENLRDKNHKESRRQENLTDQNDIINKSANNKKLITGRVKEPSKMNIDSIIEEENRERALIGRSTIIPKIKMIEIPSKGKRRYTAYELDSSSKEQSSNQDHSHKEKSSQSRSSDRLNMGTTVDQMGFVINSNALPRNSYDINAEIGETKSKHR